MGSERDGAYRLKKKERVGDGMRRIAAGRAEKALERLRGATPGEEGFEDAIHDARKDLKKLRAVVRLLRDRLGEKVYAEQNRRYRDAARALAESRDGKVKLETLDALAERFGDLPPGTLAAWREGLQRDCDRTLEGTDATALFEAIEQIEAGRDRIESWDLGSRSWGLIDKGIRRAYSRGRQAMRRAESEPTEENLHRWRKRAKDLWYDLRILHGAWPEVLGATAEEAHRLSDLLGDHHDLAVLREDLVGRRFSDEDSAALSAAISTRQVELVNDAFELGHRLYAEKPKAFLARLRAYWRAWRAS